MTSLTLQLQRLALPQSDSFQNDSVSLLFDPKHASTLDRNTFYNLGCTGLEELVGVEPSLSEFQLTLFSPSALNLERSVQSQESNRQLDSDITRFLIRLRPFLLLRPAHKCLEWLIYRFHIHRYNVDGLVACILPFHETNVFVRVIQLLPLHPPSHKWNWLHCLQKPGVPLSRLTLVTHCSTDLGFLDFLCSMVSSSVQECGPGGVRVVMSFFSSVVVSVLDSAPVSDAVITKLLPHVQKGLRSPVLDYRACSLMIVCGLSVKVDLEQNLVQKLSSLIVKSLKNQTRSKPGPDQVHTGSKPGPDQVQTGSTPGPNQVLLRESLGALIVLLQNQEHAKPTEKSLDGLVSVSNLVPVLESMCRSHDVSPLLRHLLPHLVNRTLSSSGDEAEVLVKLLECVPLAPPLDLTLTRLLLQLFLSQSSLSEDDLKNLSQRLLPVVRALETRYSGALETVLAEVVAEVLSDSQKTLFHRFLSLSATSGKFQMVGDDSFSLLLSLVHPQASVRTMALDRLAQMFSSEQGLLVEVDFLRTSVMERLKDQDPGVVSAALRLSQLVLEQLDPELTVSCLVSVLHRADISHSPSWSPVVSEVVCLLSDSRLVHSDADTDRLFWRLLPLLVLAGTRDSTRFRLGLSLAQSPTVSQHPLTAGWSQELELLMASDSELLILNQALVSSLTTNLKNMENFSRRRTMDSLCSCVELLSQSWFSPGVDPDQTWFSSGLDPGLRTSLLVLVQVLVLGLRDLSDTQHLLTARRVYSVLECHLRTSGEDIEPSVGVPALSPASSFSDWLEVYLRRCEDDDGQVFGLVLVSVLNQFISELKSPDDSFKGEVWWNPEHLDTNTCCYLSLLSQLFSLLMGGACDRPITAQYRHLLKGFVQVHLGTPLFLFRFLSLIWSGNRGDQVEGRVPASEGRGQVCEGAVLQTQALMMGAALMEAQSPDLLQEVVLKTPVFESVLVVLCSPIREMRRAGLCVLRSLSAASASPFQPITECLLKTSEEIIADHRFLSSALGSLYDESQSESKSQSRSGSKSGSKSRSGSRSSFLRLLDSVQAPSCPSFIASALLRALANVTGEEVLSMVLPAVDRHLSQLGPDPPSLLPDEAQLLNLLLGKYSPNAAALLSTDQNCTQLFIRALKTASHSVQLTALDQVSRAFFSGLEEEVQRSVLSAMLDVLEEAPSPAAAQAVSAVFKQISLDARLLVPELSPDKPSVSASVQQTRRSQMKSRSGEVEAGGGAVSWHRVTLILELLQHKKKLKTPQALVPVLFSLLTRRLEPCSEEQASVEYTKQLLLSCLLSMCSKLSPKGGAIPPDVLDPDRFSVEVVVQCIRSSEMSQTHHQALLLLSHVASIYPEKVLLNILPIFTFMGANILRLDDAYSFRVIDKTVQMVIPAVVKAQDSLAPGSLDAVVSRVLRVFVDALPHVPDHRRVQVLKQVLTTTGPPHFLWVLLSLLFTQHTHHNTATTDKDSVLEKDLFLWISICSEFEVKVQIQALVQILVFLRQLPQDKEDVPVARAGLRSVKTVKKEVQKQKEVQEEVQQVLFDVETHSSKQLRHFKYLSVCFCAHLLQSESLIHKICEEEEVSGEREELEDVSLQQLQQRLLEQILGYLQTVAQNVEQNSDKPTSKFWRVLLNKTYELLDKVIALLPPASFVSVTQGLMGNEVPNVRRKALELLNNKLQQKLSWDQEQSSSLLLLLPDLLQMVSSSSEPPLNRQTSLFSLKLLVRLLGRSHQDRFVAVLGVAVGVVTATDEDRNVTATALQCVSESITALRALAVPHLPSLMPGLLSALAHRKDCLSSELFLLSAVSTLHHLTETLPNFLSPYLQDTLLQVCRLSRLAEVSSLSPQLSLRLLQLRSSLASRVSSRVLLPNICTSYTRLLSDQKNQVVALMSVLKEHIGHMDRDQLTLHQSELTSFFLTALDFRALHCQEDLQKAEEVEGSVIDCVLSMVLKLSEVTFRPLFFKLCEWSRAEPSDRLLTFYRLSDSLALRLRRLFQMFSPSLLKPASDILQQTTCQGVFASEEKRCLLLKLVLNCLQKIFMFSSESSICPSAEGLLGALVSQLENRAGGEGAYRLRVTQDLLPCVGHFSVNLPPDLQKTLNYQLLLKTRSPDQEVRVSSLLLLEEVCSRLKENYMVLLPETIPFLSELMEDESEEVEKEVQRVVQQMETVLGEPLQSYF